MGYNVPVPKQVEVPRGYRPVRVVRRDTATLLLTVFVSIGFILGYVVGRSDGISDCRRMLLGGK